MSSPPHPCPALEDRLYWPQTPQLAFLAGLKDQSPLFSNALSGLTFGPLLRGAECPAWAAFWLPIESPRANLATWDSCPGLVLGEPSLWLPPHSQQSMQTCTSLHLLSGNTTCASPPWPCSKDSWASSLISSRRPRVEGEGIG